MFRPFPAHRRERKHALRGVIEKENYMLSGYKTYIAGALTILGAIGAFLAGSMTPEAAINLVVPAVLAMTVRNGISAAAKSS